jgi:hypothetical protein
MRVIICGGGEHTPEDADETIAAALDALHARHRFTLVGLRGAPEGAPTDLIADVWSDNRHIDRAVFPPTAARGAYADHDRNRLMLAVLKPQMVIALDGGGPDNANLVAQARAMKIKVETVRLSAPSPSEGGGQDAAATTADPAAVPPPPEGRGRLGGARRPERTGKRT